MNDQNPSPEFEEKVRKAMKAPDASPEFATRLRNELVRRPVQMKTKIFKPAWAVAFALVLMAFAINAPTLAAAVGKIFGYVPEVGLVESTNGLRMLAEPVSTTRDGVTLTISHVFVYPDRVELQYAVSGIAPENDGWQSEESASNPTVFCGGVNPGGTYNKAGDARLRLPDGTTLERDYTGKYPQNVFVMQPVYEAAIPADVNTLAFVLDCVPQARLGAVPENWEISFDLISIPAGTVVGEPVIEVTQPAVTEEAPASPSPEAAFPVPQVTVALERIIPTDANTVIYFHLNMENADPSLISIMPRSVYIVDSQGQQFRMIGSFVWQPFEHKVGTSFEFVSEGKPAPGPLTVVVDEVIAYYMPLYTEPPQATAEEMTFTFDAGEDPQYGQLWALNKAFTIAGYDFDIISVQAVTFSDIETPNYIDGSQGYDYGYQFIVEADPSLGLSIEMDIRADQCWITDVKKIEPSPLLYTQLCKGGYPTGQVSITIREMSITLEDDLKVEWKP